MAALNDYVITALSPVPGTDQHGIGIAPVLVGQVIKAGTGAPGADWDVLWSNGVTSINHADAILRVLATPRSTVNVGRRARPITSIGSICPDAIGTIRIHDANGLYVLEMADGTLYCLTAANLLLLDA